VVGGGVTSAPQTGTREEWLAARVDLLEREKELTRLGDDVARQRRGLPWVPVEKEYVFEAPDGCVGCTFQGDHFDGAIPHLNAHDVTLVCASRSPLETLEAYKRRMGWSFPWVSSGGTDFNLDFGLFTEEQRRTGTGYNFGSPRRADLNLHEDAEMMGLSAFALEDGVVYHTYSCFDRGTDVLIGTWQLLDRTPKGRFKAESEATGSGDWPMRHDEYDAGR